MKRRFDKARAYHRRWCAHYPTWDGGMVWRFQLTATTYTEFAERT